MKTQKTTKMQKTERKVGWAVWAEAPGRSREKVEVYGSEAQAEAARAVVAAERPTSRVYVHYID